MKRLRDLDKPQKIILALLLIMVLVFSILYPLTISRVGFELREGDELLFRGGVLECSNGMSFLL